MKGLISNTQIRRARRLSKFFVGRDGSEARLRHLQEECAELIIARADFDGKSLDGVLGEVADTLILMYSTFPIEDIDLDVAAPCGDVTYHCAIVIFSINKHLRGLLSREDLLIECERLGAIIRDTYWFCSLPIDQKLDRTAAYVKGRGDI
jgi:NTP pyrophosphatase (non-canonical NTP hydrolase)